MSINSTEYCIRLRGIVQGLQAMGGTEGVTSLEITNQSMCILRVNDCTAVILSIEDLAQRMDVAIMTYNNTQ